MTRVAWPFCRAWRTTGEAAKFAREVRENERRSREKHKNRRLGQRIDFLWFLTGLHDLLSDAKRFL